MLCYVITIMGVIMQMSRLKGFGFQVQRVSSSNEFSAQSRQNPLSQIMINNSYSTSLGAFAPAWRTGSWAANMGKRDISLTVCYCRILWTSYELHCIPTIHYQSLYVQQFMAHVMSQLRGSSYRKAHTAGIYIFESKPNLIIYDVMISWCLLILLYYMKKCLITVIFTSLFDECM